MNTPEKKPDAYTRRETANRLRCSPSKVDRLIAAGELRATKIGRSQLINSEDVERKLAPLAK